jgi:hypothetical protein
MTDCLSAGLDYAKVTRDVVIWSVVQQSCPHLTD